MRRRTINIQSDCRAVTEEYKELLHQRQLLKNKLEYLKEQLRTPGLKERFYRVAPAPGQGATLFQLNQMQSTLTAPGR